MKPQPGNILLLTNDKGVSSKFKPLVDIGWKTYTANRAFEGCPRRLGGHFVPSSKLFAGIMADRGNLGDMEDLENLNIPTIDIVVADVVSGFTFSSKRRLAFFLEDFEIDSSFFILTAAQNARWVTPIVSPDDLEVVIGEILKNGKTYPLTRAVLAGKALEWVSQKVRGSCDLVKYQIGRGQPVFQESEPV